MIIGICGGSGSGKTTLLKRLSNTYAHLNPSVFSMDNYYKTIDHQVKDENGEVNFDLPTALKQDQLEADLAKLVQGEAIEVLEYHFNAPPDKHVLLTIEPSKLIIVEGLFLFHYEGVKSKLDYSIFVDVDPQIQLDRRLYRDQDTRGYSRDAILYQWKNHVTPCYDQFLLPYTREADFNFHNDSRSETEFERLKSILDEKLTQ